MAVDVETEVVIDRPRVDVATYAANPNNAPDWNETVESVEWKTKKSLASARTSRTSGRLLGRRLTYTYEVIEFVPLERLVLRTADGPFALETTYTWADTEAGTRMTLRNHGRPTSFSSRLSARLMASAMRRTNRNDLARLKALLEAH